MANKWAPGMFAVMRREVESIRKATKAGTANFEEHAKLANSVIKTCHYRDLHPWCDTLAFLKNGTLVVTEQNLQYFPAKIRYYFAYSQNSVG